MNRNDSILVRRTMTLATDLRVRETGDGQPGRTIEGYAILFNTPSLPLYKDSKGEVRETIAPEAVSRELLDACDIKMTMFHDRKLILARSNQGKGTLSYSVDDKGVKFVFEAPHTSDGDKALELVRRGDLAGCSFAFTTRYYDGSCVAHTVTSHDGYAVETYTVRCILDIQDFTLAADPAYPDTSVEARELAQSLRHPNGTNYREQVSAMRRAALKIQY